MPKGVYAAASAMVTETRLLDATARNIAHAQTPGYRREGQLRVGFAQVLGDEGRTGIARAGGAGVLPDGGYHSFTDGTLDPTGNQLDVAVHGDGFLVAQDAQGRNWLTRNGNLVLDAQGRLSTREGHLIQGQGGPITIPEDAQRVVIDESGLISIENRGSEGVVRTTLDQLRLATVAQPRAMASNGVYFDAGRQPLQDASASVHQGHLERGNVNPVEELVQMVSLQRRYDAAQKALIEQSRTGDGYSDILRG
ncbi:MAG: flagellar hook basal-body protein [Planctomycetes bacterium]|nr:flagellar hook basal-body protein [Planctomycetota bacterium]